jgi:hypothetical protein
MGLAYAWPCQITAPTRGAKLQLSSVSRLRVAAMTARLRGRQGLERLLNVQESVRLQHGAFSDGNEMSETI